MSHWPEGFVALGDAVAVSNPVYGHGMSVAAQSALALREEVAATRSDRPRTRAPDTAGGGPPGLAWHGSSARAGHFYPGAAGKRPASADQVLRRYVDRLPHTATGNYRWSPPSSRS